MTDNQRGEQALTAALLTTAGCIVVAIATDGFGLLAAPLDLGSGGLWVTRVAGGLLTAIGAAGLVHDRTSTVRLTRHSVDPTWLGLRSAAAIMVTLTALALLNPPEIPPDLRGGGGMSLGDLLPDLGSGSAAGGGSPGGSRGGQSSIGGSAPPTRLDDEPRLAGAEDGSARSTMVARMMRFLPALFLLMLALLLRRAMKGHQPRTFEPRWPERPISEKDAVAGLEASRAVVAMKGGEAGASITRAYELLLEALAGAGAARRAHEAEHEHLARVLGPLGVRPEPLRRLAGLYVMAVFSQSTITEDHRAVAERALDDSLAALGAARPFAPGAHRHLLDLVE